MDHPPHHALYPTAMPAPHPQAFPTFPKAMPTPHRPSFPTLLKIAYNPHNTTRDGLYLVDEQYYPLYVFGEVELPGKWAPIWRMSKIVDAYDWGQGKQFLAKMPPEGATKPLYDLRPQKGWDMFKVGWVFKDVSTGEKMEFVADKEANFGRVQPLSVPFKLKDGSQWHLQESYNQAEARFTISCRHPKDGSLTPVIQMHKNFGYAIHKGSTWGTLTVMRPEWIPSMEAYDLLVLSGLYSMDTDVPHNLTAWIPSLEAAIGNR
ncbi:uncharacterized protein EV422DRAFT_229185 [Fimicolochytrium jonesii]|uniref:uncharacterized protein n=1 Tax=Fimicolochytrium jonesii TaxID=1396493 RepID=UPI0022FEE5D1|nr:uncharacterized protein EV422DRAFT_229185 [Fimicolochytrium jonesii]KAI8817251.1 hypothetical protein EV422DRAFT_229185 [Fimicolochytrium jonesii]